MAVIACGISWSELQHELNLQGWSTKKPHSLGVFFFSLGVFKGFNTILWKHFCYDLQVFQNFLDKPRNLSGVFTKAFSQTPCSVFFLEQTIDRQLDLLLWVLRCLKRLPESPQNKICYRLQLKHTPFSYFPIICLYSIRKCLFLQNGSYASFYILREADWMLFQASADSFYYVPTILFYISWKYKYWCIQKGLCGVVQPLIM